ncbi:uncharacterized protein LOC123542106 [Mercenaria mercenaria]|uniref:uncharacterized protein LOC123542106 n=1 Tax=Mercenaria mercenaria TaxID=6596 RepID=UPI00234E84B4|nr:uncharacterized protein LOC123542106 [Mercenaria mercenaria]
MEEYILINESKDDVIIPIGATFDTAVLHIGVRTRRDISIEKPDVKQGTEVITSVAYATRTFSENRNKKDSKEVGEKNKKQRKVGRNNVMNAQSASMQKPKESNIKTLPKFQSSLCFKLQFETPSNKPVTAPLPGTKLQKQAKSGHAKDDIDTLRESEDSTAKPEFIDASISVELPDTKLKDTVLNAPKAVNPCRAVAESNINPGGEMSDTLKGYETSVNQTAALKAAFSDKSYEKLPETDIPDKVFQQNMLSNVTAQKEGALKPTETEPLDQTALRQIQVDDTSLKEVLAMSKSDSVVADESIPVEVQRLENLPEEMFPDKFRVLKDVTTQKENKANISDEVILSKECAAKGSVEQSNEQDYVKDIAILPVHSAPTLSENISRGRKDDVIIPFEKYVIITIESEGRRTETAHHDKTIISEVVAIELEEVKTFVAEPRYQFESTQYDITRMDNEFRRSGAPPHFQSEAREDYFTRYKSDSTTRKESKVRESETPCYQFDGTKDDITNVEREVKAHESATPYYSHSTDKDTTNVDSEVEVLETTTPYQFANAGDDQALAKCEVGAVKRKPRYQSDDTTQMEVVMQSDDQSDYIDVAVLLERETRAFRISPVDQPFITENITTECGTRTNKTEHDGQVDTQGGGMSHEESAKKSDEQSLAQLDSVTVTTDIHSETTENEIEDRDHFGNTPKDNIHVEAGTSAPETMILFQLELADNETFVQCEERISQAITLIEQSGTRTVEITTHAEEAVRTYTNNHHNETVEAVVEEVVTAAATAAAAAEEEGQIAEDNIRPTDVNILNSVTTISADEEDGVFGIMDIYIKSDIHCDVNKICTTGMCTEIADFGYSFFSLSYFYK